MLAMHIATARGERKIRFKPRSDKHWNVYPSNRVLLPWLLMAEILDGVIAPAVGYSTRHLVKGSAACIKKNPLRKRHLEGHAIIQYYVSTYSICIENTRGRKRRRRIFIRKGWRWRRRVGLTTITTAGISGSGTYVCINMKCGEICPASIRYSDVNETFRREPRFVTNIGNNYDKVHRTLQRFFYTGITYHGFHGRVRILHILFGIILFSL